MPGFFGIGGRDIAGAAGRAAPIADGRAVPKVAERLMPVVAALAAVAARIEACTSEVREVKRGAAVGS